jgi:hypothetical protein
MAQMSSYVTPSSPHIMLPSEAFGQDAHTHETERSAETRHLEPYSHLPVAHGSGMKHSLRDCYISRKGIQVELEATSYHHHHYW